MNAIAPIPSRSEIRRAPSLETVGMTKIFGQFTALDDVSIKVEAGSFHALLGENGAGKSTLVKCMMGVYSPTGAESCSTGRKHRSRAHATHATSAWAWSTSTSRWCRGSPPPRIL